MDNSYELQREMRGLKNDRLMTERAVDSEKSKWAELLKGELGTDINDVLSGKKKVKLTFREKLNYKIRRIKTNLKNIILGTHE